MAKADEIATWGAIILIAVLIITHPSGTAVAGSVADSSMTNALKYLTGSNQSGGTTGAVSYGSGPTAFSYGG